MGDTDTSFVIGPSTGDSLAVQVVRRAIPSANDYWDGNWVIANVAIRAGAFRANFEANFRTSDFAGFRDSLSSIYDSLDGEARFEPMEGQLAVVVRGDGHGHFQASCTAMGEAGIGNRLEFALQFDQTDIPGLVRDLGRVVASYPSRGMESK